MLHVKGQSQPGFLHPVRKPKLLACMTACGRGPGPVPLGEAAVGITSLSPRCEIPTPGLTAALPSEVPRGSVFPEVCISC